nr:fasciclin domain-containing protein [Actinomycetota bacterium]
MAWMAGVGLMALTAGACSDATEPVVAEAAAASSRGAVQPRAAATSPTIVDVALAVNEETGEFSTLIAAVLAADLADELSARGQRTVFAPTDAAFAALDLNADNIGEVPVEDLTEILLYHIAPGRRDSGEVVDSDRIRMANGSFTTISLDGGTAYINESAIVAVDVEASNGIIHVIDGVLLP